MEYGFHPSRYGRMYCFGRVKKGKCEMKKDYQKPEAELITLVADEAVANDLLDGETGLESNNLFN